MLPFALSIFTGAFLLFQVQPVIGKYILPWFGGSPGVWTTCLLFFQTLLLGGYAYAHFSSKYLKPRNQAILHVILLVLALAPGGIIPAESWKNHAAGDPTWQILLLLVATIGLPYFVLSATGPLMQQWFSVTNPGVSPYRLYALSNVGSLLALLSYPVFFEVQFTRRQQATMWYIGLAGFLLVCGWCAWRVYQNKIAAPAPAPSGEAPGLAVPASDIPAPWYDKALWVLLPAIASILLLATTNHLCQEVAVIPFLWVLPLALYLLTFIICFDHARWYSRVAFAGLFVVSIAFVVSLIDAGSDAPMKLQVAGYSLALFVACMVCHGELYQLKPAPRHLTQYFLFISAGGALGGLLVAVVAPAVFKDYREFPLGYIMLALAAIVVCVRQRSVSFALGAWAGLLLAVLAIPAITLTYDGHSAYFAELKSFFQSHRWPRLPTGWDGLNAFGSSLENIWVTPLTLLLLATTVCFVVSLTRGTVRAWHWLQGAGAALVALGVMCEVAKQIDAKEVTPVISASRNFYGTLKVFDYGRDDPAERYYLLMHGATTHGLQFVNNDKTLKPTSYYGPNSGIGLAFAKLPDKPRKFGVIGLGTGSLSTYGRKGDTVRIYEINHAVLKLAHDPFTYLDKVPAKVDVIMGDARLELEHELARGEVQNFDVMALDAFSSDAIPVHLLTKEAFELYTKHLAPDGVIAVHISNRYLDLQPVVERLATEFGYSTATISDDPQHRVVVLRHHLGARDEKQGPPQRSRYLRRHRQPEEEPAPSRAVDG
jgi:hypothetical protein